MFDSFQKRSHESPMDWEWQTQGPVDPKTPFPLFKPQQGQKKSFESPQPASSFMGASTPAPAFRNPSFTTPRKPFDQDLFSEVSGPESSPAENTDIDDTPETRTSTAMAAFSLSNSERQPLFSRYGAEFRGSSPGRVDQRRGKLGQSIVNKVRKRKRIDRDHSLALGTRRGSYSDSEDDEDTARPRIRNIHKGKGENWFSQALTAINSKPDLPDILSKYAQFFVNACVATLSIYVLYGSVMTVKADIGRATQKEMSSILDEMDVCAREYTTNGCHNKGTLPPALITVCEKWDTCMNRDPSNVGVATLGAHTYGEILNSFVDPISFKSMIFVAIMIVLVVMVNNIAFPMMRSKSVHHIPSFPQYPTPHPQSQQNLQWGFPQTPQHNHGALESFGTPFPQIMPSQGVGERSPSKRSMSPTKGSRSPSKGDRY